MTEVKVKNFGDLIALLFPNGQKTNWDYKTERMNFGTLMGPTHDRLRFWGDQGYELVAVVKLIEPDPGYSHEVIFKKRK